MFQVYDPSEVHDKPQYTIGVHYEDGQGNAHFYAKAGAALSQYDAVYFRSGDKDMVKTTTAATRDRGGIVAAPQVAVPAGKFAFFQRQGFGRINVGASCPKNKPLYTTATAGRLDDATATRIYGIELTVDRGGTAGDAPCYFSNPHA